MTSPIDEQEAAQYRGRFPIFDRFAYLNSCSLGPLSRKSREALEEYADDWSEFGAPAWWLRWLPKIDRVQELFAQIIHTETANVTIHHSVSSALSSVASSIDYSRRNKVVVSELDFPTISYQWLAKSGVEVVFARSSNGITIPEEEYERLIDDRTAAVATSNVFYATGAVQDITRIAELAHRKGAIAIVDGYHAVGVLPVDVSESNVDFYVGGTLKWLCGGPGLTFIYAAPAVQENCPEITGWFAARDQFSFDTTSLDRADSAARFQLGTPAVATIYTGVPAIEFILDVGVERIYERIQSLTDDVIQGADRAGLNVASPRESYGRGGIVMLRMDDPQTAVEILATNGIVVDARPGKLRISPHFYNTREDVNAAMELLTQQSLSFQPS